MTEIDETTRNPRFVVSRIAVALIALIWIVFGVLKVLNPAAYLDALQQHRVIPDQYRGLGMYVGPIEIIVGLGLIFVMGSELRKPFGRAVLIVSMLMIIAFTIYLNMVDPAILQESGCGCLSDYRIASGIERSEYAESMIRNGSILFLHLVALIGPAWTMCRLRQRDARSSADA